MCAKRLKKFAPSYFELLGGVAKFEPSRYIYMVLLSPVLKQLTSKKR